MSKEIDKAVDLLILLPTYLIENLRRSVEKGMKPVVGKWRPPQLGPADELINPQLNSRVGFKMSSHRIISKISCDEISCLFLIGFS